MKHIEIYKDEALVNILSESQWIQSQNDERSIALVDGRRDIETDVADWNQDQQCKGSGLRAEVV